MGKGRPPTKSHLEHSDTIKDRIKEVASEFSALTGINYDSSFVYINFLVLGAQTAGSMAKELNIDRNKGCLSQKDSGSVYCRSTKTNNYL